jgi:hypothetical protein
VAPMPVRLEVDARLRVSDRAGRIVRAKSLPTGTDLHERLWVAHANYGRQRWTVGELAPGQWAFVAQKADRRLLIAIRAASREGTADAARAGDRFLPRMS